MLRLPPFEYHRPRALEEALELLERHASDAMPIAGGTDLVPNMKHRLFTPGHLVALGGLGELKGIREEEDGALDLGAGQTLTSVSAHPAVRRAAPALALAAGHVAGPQLRNRGTLGGNLCLDTRCTYYNQTEFWRNALGYCLKKDGDACHVTRVGKKCVAAHSADTPPVLMALGATARLVGPGGEREVPVEDFFVADGIWNTRREPGEIVTRIRVPGPEEGAGPAGAPADREGVSAETRAGASALGGPDTPTRLRRLTGYAKLRQRKSVDFPLLTVAVAFWIDPDDRVAALRGVVTGLGSRPRLLTGWDEIAVGETLAADVVQTLAERAHQQCRPLENLIVDPEWRRAMVPVFVRKAVEGAVGRGA
jgi:4-hydroxybenzoyl-CoA reductase subunit beta